LVWLAGSEADSGEAAAVGKRDLRYGVEADFMLEVEVREEKFRRGWYLRVSRCGIDLEYDLITCTYNGCIVRCRKGMSRCGRRRYIFILVKIAKVASLLSLFKVIKVITKALVFFVVVVFFLIFASSSFITFQGLVY